MKFLYNCEFLKSEIHFFLPQCGTQRSVHQNCTQALFLLGEQSCLSNRFGLIVPGPSFLIFKSQNIGSVKFHAIVPQHGFPFATCFYILPFCSLAFATNAIKCQIVAGWLNLRMSQKLMLQCFRN